MFWINAVLRGKHENKPIKKRRCLKTEQVSEEINTDMY